MNQMNQVMRIDRLFDLSHTIAAELFQGRTYPWEVLGDIGEFTVKLEARWATNMNTARATYGLQRTRKSRQRRP